MENSLKNYYIVYLTMNIVNKKIYIGVHKTPTPDKFDGYLGCGSWINSPTSYNKGKYPLHAAILKYGTSNFRRITLKVFDTEIEALNLESKLVNKDFIKKPNNYNATVGGGMPPLTNKEVNQFDLEGNFIKTWESETEIRTFYGCKVSLSDIISNKRNFAGYYWAFDNKININEYKRTSNRGFIDQYDLEGNYITSYKSTNIASQQLDIEFKKLNMAIFRMKPCEGYYFLKSGINIAEVVCKKYQQSVGKKCIHRYLESGKYDSSYTSISKAVKATFGSASNKIKKAVVNGDLCCGYRWSYFKADSYFEIENPKEEFKKPAIEQYDKEGNFIKLWENYKECKKEFPYCLDVCRGKLKSTKNYVFKYKN